MREAGTAPERMGSTAKVTMLGKYILKFKVVSEERSSYSGGPFMYGSMRHSTFGQFGVDTVLR